MAYIPEKIAFSETLATAYDLSGGAQSFPSSDISDYNRFSIQFVSSNVSGEVDYCIEQSNDNTNWDVFENGDLTFNATTATFTVERNNFNGNYVRVRIKTANAGLLSLFLTAKR